MIILETNPTAGQRATNQKTVFITWLSVGENAEAFLMDSVRKREKKKFA